MSGCIAFSRGTLPAILSALFVGIILADSAPEANPRDVAFADLRFETNDPNKHEFKRGMLTDAIESLVGKKVRIKGFMLPTDRAKNLERFVLTNDNKMRLCAVAPTLTEVVVVETRADAAAEFTVREVAISGTFDVHEFKDSEGRCLAVYRIVDALVEPVR
jgi:hypothetical protein